MYNKKPRPRGTGNSKIFSVVDCVNYADKCFQLALERTAAQFSHFLYLLCDSLVCIQEEYRHLHTEIECKVVIHQPPDPGHRRHRQQ